MKFKENAIKPGMVIHCPTEEDAMALSKYLVKLGVVCADRFAELYGMSNGVWKTDTIRIMQKGEELCADYSDRRRYEKDEHCMTIIEFSDLIEHEPRFKVGDKVKVKKIDETKTKPTPITRVAKIYEGEVFTITDITEYSDGVLYGGKKNSYKWDEEMLELVDDSSTNLSTRPLDTSTEMSAVEVLEWLKKASDKDVSDTFYHGKNFGIMNADDILNDFSSDEIIQKIIAYEAAKKAPKPVEVEYGWYCKVLDEHWLIVDRKEMWEGNEEKAKDEAAEMACQHVIKNGGKAFYRVYSICRVKEGKA